MGTADSGEHGGDPTSSACEEGMNVAHNEGERVMSGHDPPYTWTLDSLKRSTLVAGGSS